MCNPRRVLVRLAQEVREEWSRTVDAQVTERTEIAAQATLETQVDLAAELGEIALHELRALLTEGFGGWQADGDAFTLALEHGITLRYTPETGQLQVVARLSETVEAAATASGSASGVVTGNVEVEGVGRYYDDGWGGRTADTARRDAERDAQRRIAAAQNQLTEEQQRAALEAARQQAEAEARTEAQTRLREEAERRQAILHDQLETLLHESEEQVQTAIGVLLGQTYRRALVRLVQENGGEVVRDEEAGAVIELEMRI
jgi:hypothetical protein